jgi:UDP-glucose 4-epimerase
MAAIEGLQCLVLGGGGYLGRALSHALVGKGAHVRVFDRTADAKSFAGDVSVIHGDFADAVGLENAVRGCDLVFHLISQIPQRVPEGSDFAALMQPDLEGTARLLEMCTVHGVRQLLFASSGGTIYGIPGRLPAAEGDSTAPISPYGASKLAIETMLAQHGRTNGMRHLSLRIGNPYGRFGSGGARQGVVAAFIARGLAGEALEIWGDGETMRDYVHVDDVARAFIAGIGYDGPHRVMNVGSGEGRSVRQVAEDVMALLPGFEAGLRYRPASVYDIPAIVLDATRIIRELGWYPKIVWQEGLARTIAEARGAGNP